MVTLQPIARDSSPTRAGFDGRRGSSHIDLVICRNKDSNTAWTTASDGTLEERLYYCQNYHADVSALVSSSGTMIEWDKYFAYGTPFGLIGGDTNSDGDCDAGDVTQIDTWIAAPAYNVRGDIDLDGDVDATDKSTIVGSYQGITLGRGQLTRVRNRKGNAGYEWMQEVGDKYLMRNRGYSSDLGRCLQRASTDWVNAYDPTERPGDERIRPRSTTLALSGDDEYEKWKEKHDKYLECLADCKYTYDGDVEDAYDDVVECYDDAQDEFHWCMFITGAGCIAAGPGAGLCVTVAWSLCHSKLLFDQAECDADYADDLADAKKDYDRCIRTKCKDPGPPPAKKPPQKK